LMSLVENIASSILTTPSSSHTWTANSLG
jgi:hypothetical protein